MNIDDMLESLRAREGFSDNVGMVLIHNGVVRGWSRQNRETVVGVEITPDLDRMAAIVKEIEARPGIFGVLAEAESGLLKPGEDVLRLVVAGDIRETVIPALSDLLNRVKAEAVTKREIMA